LVRQEIYGYLLTHYAISALICKAATEAGRGPDRVKFKLTVRIVRRRTADPAAFPPDRRERILASIMADVTRKSTSTRSAGTGPTLVLSSGPATIPTG
jgi:hypothetical protein